MLQEHEIKGGSDIAALPVELASVTPAAKLQVPFAQQDCNIYSHNTTDMGQVTYLCHPFIIILHKAILSHGS